VANLRIATRGSALARWQAEHVATLLRAADPSLACELVLVQTEGDARADVPISALGGKGVFVKEVQAAVLDGRADIAVHSAKDLPARTPDGLVLSAVPERGDATDALVGASLSTLRAGSRVATGSARRRAQLAARVPGVEFSELRGNIATRLEKAAAFDAIVVATVALERLGLADRIAERLTVDAMVPQVGQGALAVECRADDEALRARLAGIEHAQSRLAVDAERAFLDELGGDCDLPAGAHASIDAGQSISLVAVLEAEPGVLRRHVAAGGEPDALGRQVARHLRLAQTS
jgi:hydroxymethylbilane synthase